MSDSTAPPPPSGPMDSSIEPPASGLFSTARHPTTCMLHIAFKLGAIAIFTLGPLLFGFGDFVFTFAFTTLMLAADFWTVKNLSGRLLVGMMWHNIVAADGTNEWRYERAADESSINATDKTVFWTALIVWPVFWIILTFFYFIKLDWDWMALTIMATVLGGANLVGYWKCSTESKRKLQQFASSALFKTAIDRLTAFFV